MINKELLSGITKSDSIRIAKKRGVGSIQCTATTITFKDSDTEHMVVYTPALELTGYGNTIEEAKEMLNFSVNEFFKYLLNLSPKKREYELFSLGWKQDKFHNKEYSNSFVDVKGNLKNLNVEEKSVVDVKQEEFA